MKKYFLALCTICALAFCGCSKDDDENGGSLKVDGVNIVGTWADTDTYNVLDDGLVDQIIVITEKSFREYYISDKKYDEWRDAGVPSRKRGFEFKDGYLYGCSMNDFELETELELYVKDGKLYLAGIAWPYYLKFTNDAIIDIDDPNDQFVQYNRVKGFK